SEYSPAVLLASDAMSRRRENRAAGVPTDSGPVISLRLLIAVETSRDPVLRTSKCRITTEQRNAHSSVSLTGPPLAELSLERMSVTNSRWFLWESPAVPIRSRKAEALELLRAQVRTAW